VRLRWLAMNLGFEKLVLKNEKMISYFVSDQKSAFYQSKTFSNTISFIQQEKKNVRMKEINNKLTLTFEGIKSVSEAISILSQIQ
jgi:transcription-repair coupling factor (superfamily II helicase)